MKKPPSNLGASVRQRLLNLAKERDEDFDLVLTRFALERLLYRISVSEHAGKFILKGAMLVAVWLPDAFRATRDLDLLGAGDASPAGAEAVFKDICRTRVEPDGVEFDASSVHAELIREDQQYLGTRVKLEARISGAVIHLQVDVGYGDAVVPPPTTIDFPQILEFTQPHIRAYSRYTVVAEKLQAAVELGLANSRLKDFFDLYVLSAQLEFEGSGIVAAIRATFDRREVAIPDGPPVALTARFAEDAGKLAQWRGFVRRSRVRVQVPALPAVIESVAQFALEPLEAARLGRDFRKTWRQGGPWT